MHKFYRIFLQVGFFLFLTQSLQAQNNSTQIQSKNSLVVLPYMFYSPETEIAIGAGSIYSFRPSGNKKDVRPSNIKFALTYTQRKQSIISFIPEVYFKNEHFYFSGFYTYYKYPDKFWGIGNNTPSAAEEDFTPNLLRTFTNFQFRIFDGLYFGPRFQYESIDLVKTEENSLLQSGTILGSEGGRASGFGYLLTFDTRNNIYFPSSGQFHQIYSVFYRSSFGGAYHFNFHSFDLRKYIPVGVSVLAFQTYNVIVTGTPPFQMYPLMGGTNWMRGYYLGRYRDKNMATFQAEFRFPLTWRFGAVGFLGLGNVAENVNQFRINKFKTSMGFGFRFIFDAQEKINARLDFGFSGEGDFGLYAMVVEAF